MTPITLPELIECHDELRRLLSLGQPPAVAVQICARFLERTEDAARGWWAGFGFQAALEMARRIPTISLEGIEPAEMARFERVLAAARTRPVPPLPGEQEWAGLCDQALTTLRGASQSPPWWTGSSPDDPKGRAEIRVPVISALVGEEKGTHPLFAGTSITSILRLSVEADPMDRGPDLAFEGTISPESRKGFVEALEMLAHFPRSGPKNSLLRVRWTPEGRIVGRSATFPFLLAAAVARSSFSPRFESFSLEGNFTATGDLDGARVVTVEPSTLPGKVRASYHAGARILLVPWSQETEARDEAARLADAGFGRAMEIIGVSDPREAWRNSRIVRRRLRRPRHLVAGWFHWLSRSRIRFAMVGSIAVFLAALSIAAAVITRDVPSDVAWKGDDLVFRNRHGWITNRVHFPYENLDSAPDLGPGIVVLKIEGRHVILVIHGSSPTRHDRLAGLDRRGRPIWDLPSTDVRGVQLHEVQWKAIVPLEANGQREILAVRRSAQRGLTLVDRIDPGTGALLGELRNNGHLEWLSWIDPPGETARHPAFTGTDNSSGRGIVAILETGSMESSAPIDSIGEIPAMTDPRSLERGVAAAWTFPKDRFTWQVRVACERIMEESGGLTMVPTSDGGRRNGILYYMKVGDLRHPVVVDTRITDGYRAYIFQTRPETTEQNLAAEENRLARDVRTLTPAGWTAVDFLQANGAPLLGR